MITLLKMPALFLGMLAVFCCLGSFFIRENTYGLFSNYSKKENMNTNS